MLSVALDVAQSGLTSSGNQAAVISRNIANAGTTLASRKIARTTALAGGGVVTASITRAANDALAKSLQTSLSVQASREATSAALNQLDATVNDPELGLSPAGMMQTLRGSLTVLASSPNDTTLLTTAIDDAKRLATSINDVSSAIQSVRQQADADMAGSVDAINGFLKQFDELNRQIVIGTRAKADVTDQLDARDDVLRRLSNEIGVKTLTRADNDVAIYTDGGSTLYDKGPRTVTMQRSYSLAPGVSGNSVYVDAVAITGTGALMAIQNGRLAGLAKVRDDIAVTYQKQIDETARGLLEAFAEKDQSATPSLPDIPGLFTYTGATTVPASGTLVNGLAGAIKVNPNVDPAVGGNIYLLRDGSIGDPGNVSYTYNATGASAYSNRVRELIDVFSSQRNFDGVAGLSTSDSIMSFATSSAGWLQDQRQKASTDADYSGTLANRAHDALSRATGVNLDEEMAALLDVERSYQTSSKMLATIDSMFKALLNAV